MGVKIVTKRRYTTITIPSALFARIKKKIDGTGFSSVSDYVTYVLRETVADMEMSGKSGKTGKRREDSTIIERLKALGYIDKEK